MKKIQQLFLFVILGTILSCGSQEAILEVDTFTEISVPAGLNTIEAHYFLSFDVPIPFERLTQDASISRSDITQFTPTRGTLIADNNQSIDLVSIRSVNVFIVDSQDLTKTHEIFYMDFVEPGSKTEINLFNTILDLSDVIQNDRANMEIRFEFLTPPTTTMNLRLNMTFGVFAE